MGYKLKYRMPGQWFWRSLQVEGQTFLGPQDKLVFRLKGGRFFELPGASKAEFRYTQSMLDSINAEKKAKETVPNDDVSRAQS